MLQTPRCAYDDCGSEKVVNCSTMDHINQIEIRLEYFRGCFTAYEEDGYDPIPIWVCQTCRRGFIAAMMTVSHHEDHVQLTWGKN